MKMARFFIVLICFAAFAAIATATCAEAADVTLQWTPPTEYENGEPLDPLQELERYEFGCSNTAGVYTGDVRTWISSATDERTETYNQPGTYFCALRVKALDGFGGEFSDWSTEASFIIRSRPRPPVIRTVIVGGNG